MANGLAMRSEEDFEKRYDRELQEGGFDIEGITTSQRGLEEKPISTDPGIKALEAYDTKFWDKKSGKYLQGRGSVKDKMKFIEAFSLGKERSEPSSMNLLGEERKSTYEYSPDEPTQLHQMLFSGKGVAKTALEQEGKRGLRPQMSREEIARGMETNMPELSSERNRRLGLKEPEERRRGSLRAQKMQEEIRSMRLRNDVEEYGRDMKEALTELAQAVDAHKNEDYKQAAIYVTRAYDKVPDGGVTLDIGPPRNSIAERIAYGGEANEAITVKDPQGNIRYLPVNKNAVGALIEQAKPVFNPQEYITTRAKMKMKMEAYNADQIAHPLRFEDGTVTIDQVDEKGIKKTEWFATEEEYIEKYGKPKQWVVPEYEKAQADLEAKKMETRRKRFMTSPGGLVYIGRLGEEPGIVPGTEPPIRTTGKGPTILDPSKMVKGRDEKGNEVNGWVINGKFLPMPNVSKILSKKGTITQKDIITMYKDFEKAYHSTFYGEKGYPDFQDTQTGKIIKGGSDEHIRDWVNKAMRRILPPEYQRPLPGIDEQIERKGLSKGPKTQLPPRDKEKPSKPGMRSISQPTTKKAKKTLVSVKRNKTTGDVVKIYSDGTRETIIAPPGSEATRKRIEPGVGLGR